MRHEVLLLFVLFVVCHALHPQRQLTHELLESVVEFETLTAEHATLRATWQSFLQTNTSKEEIRECLLFLLTYMPQRDTNLSVGFITDSVAYALLARATFPWASEIPWPIFLNDVLPYSVLAEPRDPWRPLFFHYYHRKLRLNATTDVIRVTEWMNQFAWDIVTPPIEFAAGPLNGLNAYSPFEVMRRHNSSCTGLSIFLVSALRSIGVPARVAGTPHWNLGPSVCPEGDASDACGNHDWVEVWSNGSWAFVDERGRIPVNTSWFFPNWTKHQVPGTMNHSIFATSWMPSADVVRYFGGDNDTSAVPVPYFPMVWDWYDEITSAWDVTARYLSLLETKR